MQNYIEKKHASPYFLLFFSSKTNQEPRKSIFNFYFYKTYQRHNLLVKLSKLAWTYVFFDLFCLKISIIQNHVSDFTCFFFICFSLQFSIIQQL